MERRKFLYSALAAASLAAIPAARSSAAATTTARREGSAPMTPSQRQNPMSCNGMVTSPHYLASQAGLDILRRGGTAIDAAVATAATLAVVYPQMCTLGGDNFWLIYDARTGTMKGLNASGRAGEKASIDFYRSRGLSKVPARGYLAANTVPGVVSGWDEAWKYSRSALGSQLSFASLLDTARELAERGFPVSTSLAYWSEFRDLQRYPGFAATYLREGKPYGLGKVMRLLDLAATLALLADKGADEFYKGSIAAAIAADLEENGGLLTVRDFARHTADWVEPISVPYRDCRAWNLPPNTQGMASLEFRPVADTGRQRGLLPSHHRGHQGGLPRPRYLPFRPGLRGHPAGAPALGRARQAAGRPHPHGQGRHQPCAAGSQGRHHLAGRGGWSGQCRFPDPEHLP